MTTPTRATAEQRARIRTELLINKPLYTEYGNCVGCLESGEVIDEPVTEYDGAQVVSFCNNCMDTALELHHGYACYLLWGADYDLTDEEWDEDCRLDDQAAERYRKVLRMQDFARRIDLKEGA